MQPVPLSLPRQKEQLCGEKERLILDKRDMDLDMEMQLTSVDKQELERLAKELDSIETKTAHKRERLLENFSTETMPGGKCHLGVDSKTGKRFLDENFPSGYRTAWPSKLELLDKSLLSKTRFVANCTQTKPSTAGDRIETTKTIVGTRRESKILDRIRMFDGAMESSKGSSLTRGPLNTISSTGLNQRVISAERKPVLYTPSSVRNSYVQSSPRSATRTPMRSGGKTDVMWTPASKDSRSRKKELYSHQQFVSHSRGTTRDCAKSSTMTASTPLKSNLQIQAPISAMETLSPQHQTNDTWKNKTDSRFPESKRFEHERELHLKTPTPIGNKRLSKMVKSRVEIKEMLGKVIEARASSIRGPDQNIVTVLKDDGAFDKIDKLNPLEKEDSGTAPPAPSTQNLSPGEEEGRNDKPLLGKKVEVAPLPVERKQSKPTPTSVECCAFGSSPPSRRVAELLPSPIDVRSNEEHAKTLSLDSSRRVSKSKLTEKIALFEKLFSNSTTTRRASTLPVAATIKVMRGKGTRSGTFGGSTNEFYRSRGVNVREPQKPLHIPSIFLHKEIQDKIVQSPGNRVIKQDRAGLPKTGLEITIDRNQNDTKSQIRLATPNSATKLPKDKQDQKAKMGCLPCNVWKRKPQQSPLTQHLQQLQQSQPSQPSPQSQRSHQPQKHQESPPIIPDNIADELAKIKDPVEEADEIFEPGSAQNIAMHRKKSMATLTGESYDPFGGPENRRAMHRAKSLAMLTGETFVGIGEPESSEPQAGGGGPSNNFSMRRSRSMTKLTGGPNFEIQEPFGLTDEMKDIMAAAKKGQEKQLATMKAKKAAEKGRKRKDLSKALFEFEGRRAQIFGEMQEDLESTQLDSESSVEESGIDKIENQVEDASGGDRSMLMGRRLASDQIIEPKPIRMTEEQQMEALCNFI